jgi:hypothetical protein
MESQQSQGSQSAILLYLSYQFTLHLEHIAEELHSCCCVEAEAGAISLTAATEKCIHGGMILGE